MFGNESLFQLSAQNLNKSQTIEFKQHIILTNNDFRFIVTEQLANVGIDPGPILIEPTGKNTAPAILAACMYSQKTDPNEVFLVAPSDHLITEKEKFHEALSLGWKEVCLGKIVTFGIQPTRPETGFGYIESFEELSERNTSSKIKKFLEKPDLELAKILIKDK